MVSGTLLLQHHVNYHIIHVLDYLIMNEHIYQLLYLRCSMLYCRILDLL